MTDTTSIQSPIVFSKNALEEKYLAVIAWASGQWEGITWEDAKSQVSWEGVRQGFATNKWELPETASWEEILREVNKQWGTTYTLEDLFEEYWRRFRSVHPTVALLSGFENTC